MWLLGSPFMQTAASGVSYSMFLLRGLFFPPDQFLY